MDDDCNLIRIKLHRCLLALTEAELMTLLKANPLLWDRAVRRGKLELRRQKDYHRQARPREKAPGPPCWSEIFRPE